MSGLGATSTIGGVSSVLALPAPRDFETLRLSQDLAFEASDHLIVGAVRGREILADTCHMFIHRCKS